MMSRNDGLDSWGKFSHGFHCLKVLEVDTFESLLGLFNQWDCSAPFFDFLRFC